MARFGDIRAQFFARGNLNTPLADGAGVVYRVPVSGETSAVMNAAGRSSLTFGYDAQLSALIGEGNVVICYQYDSLIDPPYIGGVPVCLPFTIESVTPLERGLVRIEGPDLLEELKNVQRFAPVGGGTNTATTVAVAVSDPATTTLAAGAPHNVDNIIVTSNAGWEVGDEVRITMDNGGVHVTVARSINPGGGSPDGTVQLVDRVPSDAASGNAVSRRRRRVKVASGAAAFQVGVECRLTLDDNTVHTTIVADEPESDFITMRDGAPDGAAVGKAITATDYSTPTTSDVTEIMSYMAGWSVAFESGGYTGTAAGTHHAPNGDSVYDLMVATAKRAKEFFRLQTPGITAAPKRQVVWRRTFDYAGQGGNLRLVQPAQADIDGEAANVNRAIITGDVEREGVYQPVTRVVPLAADKRITLALCSTTARLQAQVEGLTLVDTGLGLYTPAYLYNATAEATMGMIARTVTFSDIRVETDNSTEWESAADSLMRAAIAYLYEHGTGVRYRYTVPGIVAAPPIYPGQRIEMVYTSPDGRWSVNRTGGNALYVLEVRSEFGPPDETGDGHLNSLGKLTTLILVESPWDVPDMESAAAAAIVEVGQIARMDIGGTAGGSATVIVSGSGGGGVTDHGDLTGLADDDHLQYLRVDGTRPMTGSLQMGAGLLVDGVDLTAHVANPAAHHALVTAGDSSIIVSGQAVRVSPTVAGAGLDMSAGVLGVNVAANMGTTIVGDILAVKAGSGSALGYAGDGLTLLLAANSGLQVAVNSLTLGTPGTIGAGTTNLVSGSGHTHAVTATADALTTPATLLKGGAGGELALGRLGVGTATVTTAGVFLRAPATDDYTLLLKQISGQSAELLRVEDTGGNPLIRLTGGGDLESGTPAFVSRVTGWQIEHDGGAEFNNVFVRGELHAATFVADEMHATGGTLAVMTVAKVAAPVGANDNILPAIGSTFTLNTQASWDTGFSYFAVNDVIRIKPMTAIAGGGSLDLYDIYLQVTAVGAVTGRQLGSGNAGYAPLTVRRLNGGATGIAVPEGGAAVKWAKIGGSGFTGAMFLTSDLPQSPYLDIATIDATQSAATWQSAPVTPIPRVRVGNLRGVLGKSADEWGMAAGTNLSDATTAARYLVASNAGLELRNVDLNLYTGGERVIALVQGSAPYIGVGATLPTGPTAGGAGFWAGLSGGSYQVRVGSPTEAQMLYDGSALTLASGATGGRIVLNPSTQSIALGNPLPTGITSGGAGVWMGLAGGNYLFRIGHPSGARLVWTGVALSIINSDNQIVISVNNSGDSLFMGAMTIGTSGGIWQGTGTFAAPTTGLKLYNSGGIGRLVTYNGGNMQTALDTDGAFKAGWDGSAWNVQMNRDGVALTAGEIAYEGSYVTDTVKRITWNYGGGPVGWVSGRYVTGSGGVAGVEIMAGSTIAGAGARFNHKAGGSEASTIMSQGELRLIPGSSQPARVYGAFDVYNGEATVGASLAAAASLYAANGVILGGAPYGANQNTPGVLTVYKRGAHPASPSAGAVALYIYHNTGTGKFELTMRNASGATVKVAEVAAV